MEWYGVCVAVFGHEAIHHTVEEELELSGHIAPIARSANDKCVAFVDEIKYPLCVVDREYALAGCTASHACYAGMDLKVVDLYNSHLGAIGFGGFTYYVEHLRYVAMPTWTCI